MSYAIPQATIDRYKRLLDTYSPDGAAELAGISKSGARRIRLRGFTQSQIGGPPVPYPADFAVMANRMTKDEMRRHYRVGYHTLQDWLSRIDRRYTAKAPDQRMPIPSREEVAAALAQGMDEARRILGASQTTINIWRHHHGLAIQPRRTAKVRAAEAVAREQERARRAPGWFERKREGISA